VKEIRPEKEEEVKNNLPINLFGINFNLGDCLEWTE
jgi:hypothetical protein